jgi:hypothetical protein
MTFWIGILIAVGVAASALKLGLYQAWTTLFNVVIAVYVGVNLGPALETFVPAASGQYGMTLAVLATGLGTFLVLHAISYTFLIGQFEVTFPNGFNKLLSPLLGFLAGLLVWSFAVLVFCTTPFCQKPSVKDAGLDSKNFEEAKLQPYLVWWCNLVDKFAASGESDTDAEAAVRNLLNKPGKDTKGRHGLRTAADANEPNQPNEPNLPAVEQTPAPHTIIPP